jgi:DNA primase
MEIRKRGLSLEEIRELDMVDYLSSIGHEPVHIKKGIDYWYLSPLRAEKNASFKINRRKNRWYDHGEGTGGNLIDFGLRYYQCTVGEFLQKINDNLSFQQQPLKQAELKVNQEEKESKIIILREKPITSYPLIRYLEERKISMAIAGQFCSEIIYELNSREFYGIGFKNDSGGYEIRNPDFKASSSPKDITTIQNGAREAQVFEGFMDFLSFKTIHQNQPESNGDFIILNGAAFFEKARPAMEQHEIIRLWLDRDTTGRKYTKYALSLDHRYRDESDLYRQHKDLNDWLRTKDQRPRKALRLKIR